MGVMFTSIELADLRHKNADHDVVDSNSITFEKALELCRRHIYRLVNRNLNVSNERAKEQTHEDIEVFAGKLISEGTVVEAYEGNLAGLIVALKDEITDYGVITQLLNRADIDEVRVNGKRAIFYQKNGVMYAYRKRFFETDEDLKRVVDKLLGTDVRLSPSEPFKNSRSVEGWRVNAIDKSISHFREYALVIRKPKASRLNEIDLIQGNTMSFDMASLLRYLPRIHCSWFTVGPTGSGKTLINEIIGTNINDNDRCILVENPNEMRFIKYTEDEEQYIKNDFLQILASNPSSENPAMTEPTMNNLLENALRQTPTYIGAGEIRSKDEFKTVLVAMQTGHYVFTTFHADDARGATKRFLTTYLAASANEPPELVMSNLCDNVNFIICTRLFPHIGKRRITQIAEVVGSVGMEPVINMIYEYDVDEVTDDGIVKSRFIRKNALSAKTIQKFKYSGIPSSFYRQWAEPPNNSEGDVVQEFSEQILEMGIEGGILVEDEDGVIQEAVGV
ncbi:ATPase, T2SS/T4P/T4SS family [Paenibacillus pabuli]|uniref:ATPase, T2SS/T4P/T4SS family n=1 Tax=Paenibacillus pabuli TaxID=1472 RepID=UPI003242E0D7